MHTYDSLNPFQEEFITNRIKDISNLADVC